MTTEEAFTHLDQVARLVREVIDLRAERDRLADDLAKFGTLDQINWGLEIMADNDHLRHERDRLARQAEACEALARHFHALSQLATTTVTGAIYTGVWTAAYDELHAALATEGPEQ